MFVTRFVRFLALLEVSIACILPFGQNYIRLTLILALWTFILMKSFDQVKLIKRKKTRKRMNRTAIEDVTVKVGS